MFDRVKEKIPEIEWPFYAPLIFEINRLKKEKDAVILAHNYQTPQIYHGVADIVGDSLQLAIEATKVKQSVIVQCGVHFMAETSKLLNPEKTVLIPDSRAGCSLASSITVEDVMAMRQMYPGVPVVTYVNTSAAVKAVTDVCCTSSNALDIVNRVDGDTVIMIPDQYPGAEHRQEDRTRRSSPGPAPARCTKPSLPTISPSCATPIRRPRSSPIPNARPKSSTQWISPARPRR